MEYKIRQLIKNRFGRQINNPALCYPQDLELKLAQAKDKDTMKQFITQSSQNNKKFQ